MPVSLQDLEQALRDALPITHLEIIDQSSGCGESYAVLIVSEVSHDVQRPSQYDILLNDSLSRER